MCCQPLMYEHNNPSGSTLSTLPAEHPHTKARHIRDSTARWELWLCDDDDVSVVSTGIQEGGQLDAKAAAAVPLHYPGSSLAPAPLGAGGGGGRGGAALLLLLLPPLLLPAVAALPSVGASPAH